jgi:hypothetical protein
MRESARFCGASAASRASGGLPTGRPRIARRLNSDARRSLLKLRFSPVVVTVWVMGRFGARDAKSAIEQVEELLAAKK